MVRTSSTAIKPPLITVCPACGRKFGKHAKLTIARWRPFGTPDDDDIVHFGCRYQTVPRAVRDAWKAERAKERDERRQQLAEKRARRLQRGAAA